MRLRYGAPDARRARSTTLAVHLRRRPGPPSPRVAGVVARRDGNDVVVTWRTNRARAAPRSSPSRRAPSEARPRSRSRSAAAARGGSRPGSAISRRRASSPSSPRSTSSRLPRDDGAGAAGEARAARRARCCSPLPATASAAPFGELPFRPVSGPATCLRRPARPGSSCAGRRAAPSCCRRRPAGLVPMATVALGPLRTARSRRPTRAARASWRVPTRAGSGSRCATPAGRGARRSRSPRRWRRRRCPRTSARGDVVVAWAEYEQGSASATAHVRVVRRVAGGAFGAPQRLGGRRFEHPSVRIAGDADGAALADARRPALAARDRAAGRAVRRAAHAGRDRDCIRRRPGARGHARRPGAAGGATTEAAWSLFDREPGGDFVRRPTLRAAATTSRSRCGRRARRSWRGSPAAGRRGLRHACATASARSARRCRPVAPRSQSFGGGSLLAIGGDGGPPHRGQTRAAGGSSAPTGARCSRGAIEGHGTAGRDGHARPAAPNSPRSAGRSAIPPA